MGFSLVGCIYVICLLGRLGLFEELIPDQTSQGPCINRLLGGLRVGTLERSQNSTNVWSSGQELPKEFHCTCDNDSWPSFSLKFVLHIHLSSPKPSVLVVNWGLVASWMEHKGGVLGGRHYVHVHPTLENARSIMYQTTFELWQAHQEIHLKSQCLLELLAHSKRHKQKNISFATRQGQVSKEFRPCMDAVRIRTNRAMTESLARTLQTKCFNTWICRQTVVARWFGTGCRATKGCITTQAFDHLPIEKVRRWVGRCGEARPTSYSDLDLDGRGLR